MSLCWSHCAECRNFIPLCRVSLSWMLFRRVGPRSVGQVLFSQETRNPPECYFTWKLFVSTAECHLEKRCGVSGAGGGQAGWRWTCWCPFCSKSLDFFLEWKIDPFKNRFFSVRSPRRDLDSVREKKKEKEMNENEGEIMETPKLQILDESSGAVFTICFFLIY